MKTAGVWAGCRRLGLPETRLGLGSTCPSTRTSPRYFLHGPVIGCRVNHSCDRSSPKAMGARSCCLLGLRQSWGPFPGWVARASPLLPVTPRTARQSLLCSLKSRGHSLLVLPIEVKLGDQGQSCRQITKSNTGVLFNIFRRALRPTSTLPQLPLSSNSLDKSQISQSEWGWGWCSRILGYGLRAPARGCNGRYLTGERAC